MHCRNIQTCVPTIIRACMDYTGRHYNLFQPLYAHVRSSQRSNTAFQLLYVHTWTAERDITSVTVPRTGFVPFGNFSNDKHFVEHLYGVYHACQAGISRLSITKWWRMFCCYTSGHACSEPPFLMKKHPTGWWWAKISHAYLSVGICTQSVVTCSTL